MIRAPYPGRLKQGSTGESVVLLKRALRAAGLLPGKGRPTGYLGPFARRAIIKLGHAKHLGGHKRTLHTFETGGVYGPRAHRKLAPYYDQYGATRLRAIHRVRQLGALRAAGVAACELVIRNRGSIYYTQSGLRMSGVRGRKMPPGFGRWEDCSSEATWIAFVMDQVARRMGGSYPDPNGLGYNGQGFTGTMTRHGIPVSAYRGMSPFVFVFYGWPIGHVVVRKSPTRVMSMGSNAGPLDEFVGYRTPTTARFYPPRLPA